MPKETYICYRREPGIDILHTPNNVQHETKEWQYRQFDAQSQWQPRPYVGSFWSCVVYISSVACHRRCI